MALLICRKSSIFRRLLSVVMICALLPNGAAWGGLQPPLSSIPVPEPANLGQFLRSGPDGKPTSAARTAAIQLGKALFWDMQAGSDGLMACASCHYGAGADPINIRSRNQLNPGPDTIFGNNSTVVRTFVKNSITGLNDPLTLRATANPRFQPDYTLQQFLDFPLFSSSPADNRLAIDPLTGFTGDAITTLSDTNDVVGSQGVRLTDFLAINAGSAIDSGTPVPDPVFHIGPSPNTDSANNTRQVTGRNSPPVINAVFNFANFWDGRAHNIFNGVNPFGPLDQSAGIWIENSGVLQLQKIAIPNSSLASQATGPALSSVEMSFKGRTFPELGRKMLSLTPLNKQRVHPSDGVLGSLSKASLSGGVVTGNTGLGTDYTTLIQAAFQPYLWQSSASVPLATVGGPVPFTQMEANFSLFWGLAIQLYEATLVSDKTPFDQFQAGNTNALSPDLINIPNPPPSAVRGLALFDSKCAVCHSGAELTSAATGSRLPSCIPPDCNTAVFTNNTIHRLIQQETNPATFTTGVFDTGFMNIGVRSSTDDPGRGGSSPFTNSITGEKLPLSFTRLANLDAQGKLPFVTPILPVGITLTTPDIVQGAFKVPSLRNVELTPPYFHNGDAFDLTQVVEFYTRGGNFPNNPELAVAMQPIRNLRNQPAKKADLVEFLKALTDDRVKNETAPFDHPELFIPSGDPADTMIALAATGGSPPVVAPNLTLDPVTTPTSLTSQLFSGTVDPSGTVQVQVNSLPPLFATVTGTTNSTWSLTVTGLPVGSDTITFTAATPSGGLETQSALVTVLPIAIIFGLPPGLKTTQNTITLTILGNGVVTYRYSVDGGAFSTDDIPVATPIVLNNLSDTTHTISVLAKGKDSAGNPIVQATPTTASWSVKANPPLLTLNPVISPAGKTSQTIGGTVELGSIPSISIDTTAKAGPVRTIGGGNGISTWSCDITGLVKGANNITVTALDFVFHISTQTAGITIILPDGNFKGTGVVDLSDAIKALRIAVGLDIPTTLDMLHGDVAPLVSGVPAPNNTIDITDALAILRKVVGLISF